MKALFFIAFSAAIFFSACGVESADAIEAVHPVDIWLPFVQVAPPGNIWETDIPFATVRPESFSLNAPYYVWVFHESVETLERRWPDESSEPAENHSMPERTLP